MVKVRWMVIDELSFGLLSLRSLGNIQVEATWVNRYTSEGIIGGITSKLEASHGVDELTQELH